MLIQKVSHIHNIRLGGNKRRGHVIHIILNAKKQIFLILFRQIGTGHHLIGEAHALSVAQNATGNDLTHGIITLQFHYFKDDQAVIDHNLVANAQIIDQAFVVYGNLGLISFDLIGGKSKGVTVFYFNLTFCESTNPVLRTLGIKHHGNGKIQLIADLFDQIHLFLLFRMSTMRKIQTSNIHARQAHLSQNLFILAGRANGADDLCLAHFIYLLIFFSFYMIHLSFVN